MPCILSGHDLTCIRGERTVFAGLDFALEAGGALVLTGPNGSGKSSLLRLMAGILAPASGVLCRNGADVADDPAGHRADLHYVGHQDAVKAALSAAENLAFWSGLRGTTARVGAALEAFGLDPLAELPARFLSAGEKRRLALARLIAAPAALWLLDEPTVALDRAAIDALMRLIAEHRTEGGAIVVSTHADLALDGETRLDMRDFSRPREPASETVPI